MIVNIPAKLLFEQLQHIGAKLDESHFTALYQQLVAQYAGQPLECLKQLFQQLDLHGYRAALLPWQRFDRRLLPAAMLFNEQWWMAKNGEGDEVQLIAGDTLSQLEYGDQTVEAWVLWIRAPQTKREAASGDVTAGQLIRRALLSHKAWIGNVAVATVLVNLFAIFTSLFAMQVYDRVVPTLAYATLTTLVVGMLLVTVLDWVLKWIRTRIVDSLSADVDTRLSQYIYEHLLALRLDRQNTSLGMINAQVNGLETVRQFFTSSIVFGLVDLPFCLLFVAVIGVIGGKVGWVYALLLPVGLVIGLVIQVRLKNLVSARINRSGERQGLLIDSIRGAETIRTNNAGWRFAQEWRQISQSIANYTVRQKALSHMGSSLTASLSSIAYVSAIVVGVTQIEAGELTMGGMIACTIIGGRVIAPVAQSVNNLMHWQSVSHSLSMVNDLLSKETERRSEQTLLMLDQPINLIELDKIRFGYEQSPVHQLIVPKLTIRAGERIVLMGPVGCGKSTLLKLLAGLYRPSEGMVKFNGIDLWELDPQLLNAQMNYLPQQVHLFKGSLKDNLLISGTVSDQRMMQVAAELGINEVANSHPLGMDMPLAEGGEGLSGGQRQLVALSRTVAAQPRLWLLDEPTSSLDAETEKQVWQVLQANLREQDIVIVSTHRPLAAAHMATRMLVMKEGQIVRDGTPQELFPNQLGGQRQTLSATVKQGAAHANE
ncbi:ATP-binding cassette domain-containing protein [Shewanella sp. A3A]|nr:ATP-binding cassette domain-containing protein [Shewanella ferrihydritica]